MAACRAIFGPKFAINTYKSIVFPRVLYTNYTQNEQISHKHAEQLGLASKPKKPMSPFFKFLQTWRKTKAAENKKPTELSKLAGEEWQKLTDDKKKELHDEYEEEMKQYVENMITFEKTLTPQQRDAIDKFKEEKKMVHEKIQEKRKLRELNKPKKPQNSFMLYIEDMSKKRTEDEPYMIWRAKATKAWYELSEAEKDKYRERYQKSMEEYSTQLESWEAEMIRAGHSEVVRRKNLI